MKPSQNKKAAHFLNERLKLIGKLGFAACKQFGDIIVKHKNHE